MYFVEKIRGINISKQFDYSLFSAVLILSVIGIFIVRSATLSMTDGNRIMIVQVAGLVIGIVLALLLSFIDYKDFKTIGIILYIISIILLLLVLIIGTGDVQRGSRSWIRFAGVGIQPAEIAKITFVILISIFFERINEGGMNRSNIIKLLFYSALPIALVLAQPDTGTSLVFIFVFLVMLFICGIPYKYIFTSLGAFLAACPLLWFFILKEYQKTRILVFLFPDMDPQGKGYNVLQAKRTIGSGQLYGKGLFGGLQTQNGIVPEKQTDFIFTVIGEELGFIGSVVLVALVLFILLKCISIAKNSRDSYGSFLVVGMTSMWAFHAIENVGMCIGLMPVTGIPLPFVSSGGSSIVANYIALGIILSVSIRKKKIIFNTV